MADRVHERPMRHELKTIPPFFQDVLEGRKTFELRYKDRDYQVGDVLWLREYLPGGRGWSERSICKQVVYMIDADDEVLPPAITGLTEHHVLMGLGPVTWPSASPYGDPIPPESWRG